MDAEGFIGRMNSEMFEVGFTQLGIEKMAEGLGIDSILDRLDKLEAREIDMTGAVCKECGKGYYEETSVMDDIDGTLHCPECRAYTDRWVKQ